MSAITLHIDADGIAIATLDLPGRSMNVLNDELMQPFVEIIERLEKCGWSQTEAAESLHVPLSTLNQKIKRLDIKIRKKSEG